MNLKFKRSWSAGAALVVAASIAPLLSVPAAYATGTLSGAATVKDSGGAANLNSGNSDTTFTLRLPAGASCPGDSPNDGYRWQTYMVPASVNPNALTFGSTGPILPTGTPAGTFKSPLFTTGSTSVVNQQTPAATAPGGPGPIVNIPDMNYAVYTPGQIPAGTYNIGIACTLGGASTTQMKNYWNVQKAFTANTATGGTAGVNWVTPPPFVATAPNAPTLDTATPGDTTLTVNFTPGAAIAGNPATTGYTATATPTSPAGPPVTQTGTTSPIGFTGLTNGTAYSVTVRATNSVGNSPESNAVSALPTSNFGTMVQEITATRPAGALVFTQICGKHNAITADAAFGTPAFAASAGVGETPPWLGSVGGTPADTSSYPYVASPFPVTYCGLQMGPATIIRSGAGAGQFLISTAALNQVTVADTRDTDIGWNVSGVMADLASTSTTRTISGNQLGLKSVVAPTPAFSDGTATGTYAQTANGYTVNPGSTTGLGSSRLIATGAAAGGVAPARTGGLGVAQVDAALKLLIPVSTPAANYKGQLTLTLT